MEEAKNCDEEQEKMLSEKLQKEKLETECEKQPAKDVQRTQKDEAILTPNSREGNVDSPQTPAIAKTNFSVRVRYLLGFMSIFKVNAASDIEIIWSRAECLNGGSKRPWRWRGGGADGAGGQGVVLPQ